MSLRALLIALALASPALAQSGRLVDVDGKPLANRAFVVRSDNTAARLDARTDADGRFRVNAAPLGPRATLEVSYSDLLHLSGLDTAEADWGTILVPAPCSIRGTLLRGNRPVPDARVDTDWTVGRCRFPTDADGRFLATGSAGLVQLSMRRLHDYAPSPAYDLNWGQRIEVTLDYDQGGMATVAKPADPIRAPRLILHRVGPDDAWGLPVLQTYTLSPASNEPQRLPPGTYQAYEYQGSSWSPGEHPFRSWQLRLVPGENAYPARPATAPRAIPVRYRLLGVTDDVDGEPHCTAYRLTPPALTIDAFRRWPLAGHTDFEAAWGNPMEVRYPCEFPEDDGSWGIAPDPNAKAEDDDDEEEDDDEEVPSVRVIRFFEPGRYGVSITNGDRAYREVLHVGAEAVRREVQPRPGGATLVLAGPSKRIACRLRPLYALVVDPKGQVCWAGSLDEYGGPVRVPGLPTGACRVLYAYEGFTPRSVKVQLSADRPTTLPTDPF